MKSSTVKTGSRKHWYDYLWAVSLTYLALGFFNIMFAWLGLICFIVPLMISIVTGSKVYCNRYCGRGQLFAVLGKNSISPATALCPAGLNPRGSATVFWPFL